MAPNDSVLLELDGPDPIANWRPLVHWLLAIPHLVIGGALSYVAGALGLISWFIIVFTGRLPQGLANFQCMLIRYQLRAYTYLFWLRESYPPFEFSMTGADPGGDPLRLDFTVQLEDRSRLSVGLRFIWLIPAMFFAAFVGLGAILVAFLGFFAVLFTGKWPEGMRQYMVGYLRVSARISAYTYLLTDEYPPFSLS